MNLATALSEIRVQRALTSKEAGVLQHARTCDLAVDGDLGTEVQGAMLLSLQSLAKKEATDVRATSVNDILSEGWQSGLDEQSRRRRLAELLKKRETTGTAGGSASPNPPGNA